VIKTLQRVGNSSALVIDKTTMKFMEIDQDTPLSVTLDGRKLIVEPLTEQMRKSLVRDSMRKTGKKYARVFRKLAE